MRSVVFFALLQILSTMGQTCRNGFAGVQRGNSCCTFGCGVCDALPGCETRGAALGLGADDCCADEVLAGDLCSDVATAPCRLDPLDTTCDTNGFPGFEGTNSGTTICCSNGCGQCGGRGCSFVWDPLLGPDCCSGPVLASGVLCSVQGAAPCIIDNPTCILDSDCDIAAGEECCPATDTCLVRDPNNPAACGDPHMTGFRGQKFDFTGTDGEWYCLLADAPAVHLNMRVTSPVPAAPQVTYITGVSLRTVDADGKSHTVVIEVTDPHNLESACPAGVSPCLADGSLTVLLDGKEALLAPGTVSLGRKVDVSAANLPGACRSFGFERYWERKKAEAQHAGRRLQEQTMAEWILGDPTATNLAECTELIADAISTDGHLFGHQSEHASFKVDTPTTSIRISHGRLHQLPMRDPTDKFDLPDHISWQMNVAMESNDVSRDARGVLGETIVPTLDLHGNRIMEGMGSVRGLEEDYHVASPLGVEFSLKY